MSSNLSSDRITRSNKNKELNTGLTNHNKKEKQMPTPRSPPNKNICHDKNVDSLMNNRVSEQDEMESVEQLKKALIAEQTRNQRIMEENERRKLRIAEVTKTNEHLTQRNAQLLTDGQQTREELLAARQQLPPAANVAQVVHNVDNNAINNDNIIRGLATHLPYISLNPKIPMYNDKMNPKEYLEEIKNYLKMKKIPEELRLMMVENVLANHMKTWFKVNKQSFVSFEIFENKFLEEYYSIPT